MSLVFAYYHPLSELGRNFYIKIDIKNRGTNYTIIARLHLLIQESCMGTNSTILPIMQKGGLKMCRCDDYASSDINLCCFSCCDKKELVTEKLCCDFNISGNNEGTATTLFTADPTTACDFIATGSIENCGSTFITVQFVRGVSPTGTGGSVVRTLIIPADGCATFTVRGFDLIRAFTNSGTILPESRGEICIIQRFRVH